MGKKKKSMKYRSSNKLRNQHDDVLAYLEKHGSITQLDCYRQFPAPITRLSAIILTLKVKVITLKVCGRKVRTAMVLQNLSVIFFEIIKSNLCIL